MSHTFKIGDVVQLNAEARKTYLPSWQLPKDKPSLEVFSGLMTITNLIDINGPRCEFFYPETHPHKGTTFSWPQNCLELVSTPAVQVTTCQCSMRVLMMTGCKCQGI